MEKAWNFSLNVRFHGIKCTRVRGIDESSIEIIFHELTSSLTIVYLRKTSLSRGLTLFSSTAIVEDMKELDDLAVGFTKEPCY